MEEIELTFLLKEWPKGFAEPESKDMLDIYLPAASNAHAVLCIRKSGEKYEITKKEPVIGTNSSHQLETTILLTIDEYTDLAILQGKRVQKTRYYFNENGQSYEIDVFKDNLAGLVLVDIEFDSLTKMKSFTMPSWCLRDVTQEKFIAGGMLAGKKYLDIEQNLSAIGYVKK